MSVNDLIFTHGAVAVYGPVRIEEDAGSWIGTFKVQNLGEETLDSLGFWIKPSTNLGPLAHPITKTPDEDYQDLLTWGQEQTEEITTQGGLWATIPTGAFTETSIDLPTDQIGTLASLEAAFVAALVDPEDLLLRQTVLDEIALFAVSVAELGQGLQSAYDYVAGQTGLEALEADLLTLINDLDNFIYDLANALNFQHSQGFDLNVLGGANLLQLSSAADVEIDSLILGNPQNLAWSATGLTTDDDNLDLIVALFSSTVISSTWTPEERLGDLIAQVTALQSGETAGTPYILVPTASAPVRYLINREQGFDQGSKLAFATLAADQYAEFTVEFEPQVSAPTRRLYVDFVIE